MKHKGSISQTYKERDFVVLPRLVRQAKHLAAYPTTMKKLYQLASELPTDKFYICDDAAYAYINKRYIHGVIPQFRFPEKAKLFDALYNEVVKMMKEEKYKAMGLKNTTILALSRPAPCVGLAPAAIRNIMSLIKLHKK